MIKNPLAVPMPLSACMFSGDSDDYVGRSMNYMRATNEYLSGDPNILIDKGGSSPQRGVTLSWTIPYGLRTGTHDGNELEFKNLPNRWLVVRTNTDDTTFDSEAWVVASDYIREFIGPLKYEDLGIDWAEPKTSALKKFSQTYLGVVMKVENFDELGSAARGLTPPLTPVSGGNEMFLTFEPFCQNVFSFRDKAGSLGVSDATFSYFVVGWYSESNIDPIAELAKNAGGDINDFLKSLEDELGWTPASTPPKMPGSALYFGNINNVKWTPDNQPKTPVPDRDDVLVIVGQTADEALDVFIEEGASDGTNPFAKALQDLGLNFSAATKGILEEFESLGGLSQQSRLAHKAGFGTVRGATEWTIINPVETTADGPIQKPTQAMMNTFATLNAKEQTLFNLENLIAQIKTIYADTLWKAGRLKVKGAGAFPKQLNTAESYWKNIREQLGYDGDKDPKTLAGKLTTAQASYTKLKNVVLALETQLRDDLTALNGGFRLESTAGESQFIALDPVVMLTTDKGSLLSGADDPQTFGQEGLSIGLCQAAGSNVGLDFSGPVVDVIPSNIYSSLTFAAGKAPVKFLSGSGETVGSWISSLLGWMMLGDSEIGPTVFKTETGQTKTSAEIRAAMLTGINDFVFNPKTSTVWEQPWYPLFMEWEVEINHFPLFTDNGMENWKFDGQDFELTASATSSGTTFFLQGRSLLSSHLRQTVSDALEHLLDDYGVDKITISNILQELDSWDYLNQRLTGLGSSLLLREHDLKRIGHEYAMEPFGAGPFTGTVPQPPPWEIGTDHQSLPGISGRRVPTIDDNWAVNNTVSYRDLQGQQMQIEQLLVVDQFGQSLHVAGKFKHEETGRVLDSRSMAVASSLQADANLLEESQREVETVIQLPPRVLQNLKCAITPIDHVQDPNTLDISAVNPVIGFVVLNRYNREIQIHSASGQLLGAVHEAIGSIVVFEPLDPEVELIADLAKFDPDLREFVNGLVEGEGLARFKDFYNVLEAASWRVDPLSEREAYFSVLTGQPLALYRAEFDFMLAGNAITNPFKYFDFESGVPGSPYPEFSDQQFPFLLGNPLDLNDGLVGYFDENKFDKFYSGYAPLQPVTSDYIDLITPASAPKHSFNTPAKKLVLLANPHGYVEVKTGIAPSNLLSLPVQYWRDQLVNMAPSLGMGPLLAEVEQTAEGKLSNIFLPQSSIESGHLSWKFKDGASLPISPASDVSGITERSSEFIWGRVLFDRKFTDGNS